MEIVLSIAAKISEYTVEPIIHQLGYLIYYNRNIKDLNEKVENLVNFREEVQHRVEGAKRNAEAIEVKVDDWFNKADEIIGESKQFQENDGEAKKKCFNKSYWNLVQRHRLSRRAKKLMERVLQVEEEGKFERVSYCRDPQQFMSLIDGKNNYVTFKSRNSIMETIMKALKDSNIYMIGVYGMGGVGKTELVKEILKRVKETKMFNTVVLTTISQDPNVRKIQGEIGDMLGLTFEEESIQGRASKLLMRLLDEKDKILIVLDDIWKFLDLRTVGIPCNGCKILLTSRDSHILFNDMDVKMNFELKSLDNEESWNFFKQVIDVANKENSYLEPMAHQVANECGGLPIALVSVAKALRGKSLRIWEDALDQLKSSNVVNIKGMNEKVYSSLQLSYNFLEHDEMKNLFLFCSMYPEDYDIEVENELLRYVMGLRLLDHNHHAMSMAKVRNRIIKLMSDLKSSSLLSESEKGSNYVKMHDVVRDFARSFVSKYEEMRRIRRNNVSFVHCDDFDKLLQELNFSELELLVLTSNNEGTNSQVPKTFFNRMDKIKVLGFEGGSISVLPSSPCSLTNLRTLSLLECTNLKNIDLINDVKGLEILSIRGSNIKELPLVISQLTQLKVLDLSDCWNLVIPPNIISRLTNLEELNLKGSFCEWEWEGDMLNNQEKDQKASLSELKCLPRLAALHTWIRIEKILSEQMFSKEAKLERFEIIIGKEELNHNVKKTCKELRLSLNSRIVFNNDLEKLVNSAEEIVLGGLIRENDVFSKFGENHMHPQLKHLSIYDNSDIDEHLISEADPHLFQAFAALESLHLQGMRRLESMICGDIILRAAVCLEKLRLIKVKGCDKMRNLFVFSVMKYLPNLQEIRVEDCWRMEGIVEMENDHDLRIANKLELHQLKCLVLQKLPQFTSFCFEANKRRQVVENYSEQFDVIKEEGGGGGGISNFEPRFSDQVEFCNLEALEIYEIEKLKMIWDDKLTVGAFGRLKALHISDCKNLRKVFSSSVIKAFKVLDEVWISYCDSLEEIFEVNSPNPSEKYDLLKIPLRELSLCNLPKLKHVWSTDSQKISLNFPNLVYVIVDGCPKLKNIFPVSFTKYNALRQLQSLTIYDCGVEEIFGEDNDNQLVPHKGTLPNLGTLMTDNGFDNVKSILHDELVVDSFSNLTFILIFRCKSLKKIFPSNIMGAFRALERIRIVQCESLERIFEIDETKVNERSDVLDTQKSSGSQGSFLLPTLRSVEVSKCPKLASIFPVSSAKNFPQQLQELNIQCPELEEIFEKEHKSEPIEKDSVFREVSFSNLKSLILECDERVMRIFELTTSPINFFPRLEIIELIGFHCFKWTHWPPAFGQVMPKLEKIKIENMFLMEIFSRNQKSATLKELHLKKLPKLMHIWKEGCGRTSPSSKNLEILKVEGCSGLQVIVPLSLTLQNLTILKISGCHGLTNLLSCSVAKSLVQLQMIHVKNCKNMTSIIGEGDKEEGEEEEETKIIFKKLNWLKLYSLPRVKAFHSGKCTLKFPCLKMIEISQCFEMNTFSLGMIICTAQLQMVYMDNFKWSVGCSQNVNATIRNEWEDDNICQNLFQEEQEFQVLKASRSLGSPCSSDAENLSSA